MSTAGTRSSDMPARWEVDLRPPVLRWALVATLGLVLALATALQVMPSPNSSTIRREAPLADYFPRSLGGWTGEDKPLGETESVSKAVEAILDYDEAFQRVYRKKDTEFVLYVAYWTAGKMPARDVGSHIPDQCWVSVGWKRTAADYRYQLKLDGQPLAPAQYREFTVPGDREQVVYWHILDGKAIFYSGDGPPSQMLTIKSLLRHGMSHKGEQYFIRLSSRTPIQELMNDDGFVAIMELVAQLGPGLTTDLEPF